VHWLLYFISAASVLAEFACGSRPKKNIYRVRKKVNGVGAPSCLSDWEGSLGTRRDLQKQTAR
jgi:hypothetical protein